ncbi:hypothetical protein [Neobacillus sp. OS1-33]|uniref:hypothetical protein n=1 Tax=Neobacillus sp. OS1-33 TaxID=3070683 RepID=UPI0027E132DE|nr:hypothetical protein [Neobacillus sp. OS1-33]WML27011.1 hypothetical protein RCG22_05105 [Neobacillus sp. OS1-33]
MKILFVTCLLAIASTILIISLDLLMGVQISGIFWKAINPFRVMEPAEYIIILLCIMVYFVDTFGAYLKKKKEKENPSN